jgi:hypothetical protein
MKFHKTLLIGLSVATLGGISIPLTASARVSVGIYLDVPPPPARVEFVPAPRYGYVWVPGYWDVRYHRHVWREGYWVHERPGYYYAPATWVSHGNRWELQRGNWRKHDRKHDHDDDGVPNRYDRSPNNPHRR